MNYSKKPQNKTKRKIRKILYASTASLCCLLVNNAALGQRNQSDAGKEYNIPPSDMSEALQAFSEQSDAEIIYAEKDVAEKTTKGVEGEYSQEQALEAIIGDSGLVYEINADGVIVIRTAFLDVKQAGTAQQFRVAQADQSVSRAVETIGASETDDSSQDENVDRDIILVTGTNIRGIAPESSPTRTFDREDIQISGAATAQDFIQTLPANFGGGSNADIGGLPNNDSVQFNSTRGGAFGSSVNLRGLGSGSTLVLLNGHRVAPSSGIGDFVDISMIPASAIERVEILTDGASSIYGADAVAGVVNFVLRDDFDGVEGSFRYGTVTEGDLDEYRASITAGKNWSSGNAILVYEYFNQDNLSVDERSFSQGAPLPNDLLPSQERHSVLASASQELLPELEIFGDISFSSREAINNNTLFTTGATFLNNRSTENLNIAAGGVWKVSPTWFIDFSGVYSTVNTESDDTGNSPQALRIDSDIWTADIIASGNLFALPAGDVKLAIGGHYRSESFSNFDTLDNEIDRQADRDVYAVFGEAFIPIIGPSNAIPAVHRLELNVSGRFSDFSDFGSTANPKVGVLWSPVDTLRLRGSYSTSFNPPALGRIGSTDRAASAGRTSFFNSVFDLMPGDPSIADVVLISVGGTAVDLRAEESRAFTGGFDYKNEWGKHGLTLTSSYFDIKFENRLGPTPIPNNSVSFDAPNIAFNSPELFPAGTVVFDPSIDLINEVIASLDRPLFAFPGVDPLDAEIINFAPVVRNLSLTFVRGFDFDIGYTYAADFGSIIFGLDGTYLRDFQQQGAVTTPIVEQINTQFNPVDLRLRGRAGFSRNGFTANLFLNYVNDYRVDNMPSSPTIDSWTTVDLAISYDTKEKLGAYALNNTTFRLSVLNLFDEAPPETPGDPSFGVFGFDATNASPLNRFIAFELTKRF